MTFTKAWLLANRLDRAAKVQQTHLRLDPPLVSSFDWRDILDDGTQGDEARSSLICAVAGEGVAIIEGHEARDERAGAAVAKALSGALSRNAVPMSTMYGETWIVRAEKKPINVAFTAQELELHNDLVYCESPPLVQILACTKFDACVLGGESTFASSFGVAEEFARREPEAFATLSELPTTWEKSHLNRPRPYLMRLSRPVFDLAGDKSIVAMRWAPPFEGNLRGVRADDMDRYWNAHRRFAGLLDDVSSGLLPGLLQLRMKPGEATIFSNRTILHGRRGFTANGGQRELVGAYVSAEEFIGALALLPRKRQFSLGIGDWSSSLTSALGKYA
jgi:alpha-ketoglutarate-dependent taurine dioxygenase